MTEIRCPNCGQVNPTTALQCSQCGLPFGNLPPSAYVTAPTVERPYDAVHFGSEPMQPYPGYAFGPPPLFPQENETGRKTFFWYRAYCGFLALIYLALAGMGLAIAYFHPVIDPQSPEETLIMGIVYAVFGAVSFLIFLIGLVLPPKPYNWIVGIVMLAIGFTSCCTWPAVIPLFIFWIKPETQRFFGRK